MSGVKLSQTKANGHNEFGDVASTLDQTAGRLAVQLYNPHRTLQKDGSVLEGFKPDDIHDALHKPTGNKQPFIVGQPEPGDRCAYDPQPDGRRYAACGDGVVANVAEWIAGRIIEHGGAA